jgi:excisionase family DNA binding protein
LSTVSRKGKGRRITLTVEQAARLYTTSPTKIRRAAGRGELDTEEHAGRLLVFIDPERDTLTSPQAARLLAVQTQTIRKDVARGRLPAKRDGRDYRIPLAAVAEDRRFPSDLRALLVLGDQPGAGDDVPHPTARRTGPLRANVDLHLRVSPPAAEALAAGRERFGSLRAAAENAFLQLGETLPLEAELRRRDEQLAQQDDAVAQARAEARAAKERATKLPDELWCDGCRAFVPLAQLEPEDSREHTGLVWRHRHQGIDVVRYGSEGLLGRRKYGQ